MSHFPPHARMLTGLILCRSCAGNHCCCGFMRAGVLCGHCFCLVPTSGSSKMVTEPCVCMCVCMCVCVYVHMHVCAVCEFMYSCMSTCVYAVYEWRSHLYYPLQSISTLIFWDEVSHWPWACQVGEAGWLTYPCLPSIEITSALLPCMRIQWLTLDLHVYQASSL